MCFYVPLCRLRVVDYSPSGLEYRVGAGERPLDSDEASRFLFFFVCVGRTLLMLMFYPYIRSGRLLEKNDYTYVSARATDPQSKVRSKSYVP